MDIFVTCFDVKMDSASQMLEKQKLFSEKAYNIQFSTYTDDESKIDFLCMGLSLTVLPWYQI